jgi:hypothetical protein
VLPYILASVALALVLLVAASFVRSVWRLLRGEEEIEPRSWGRQFSRRRKDETPDAP